MHWICSLAVVCSDLNQNHLMINGSHEVVHNEIKYIDVLAGRARSDSTEAIAQTIHNRLESCFQHSLTIVPT